MGNIWKDKGKLGSLPHWPSKYPMLAVFFPLAENAETVSHLVIV